MHFLEGLGGLTVGLFTRVLGWTSLEIDILLAKMRTEMKDRSIHSYETV